MAVVNASQNKKSVADPIASYESMRALWEKSRAIIGGERFAKDYDGLLDVVTYSNLLLPFSPSMTQQQYDFYKSEAELPGIVSQYARIIVGGLLRKQPQLKFNVDVPTDTADWILNEFTINNSPMVTFLDECLWEEMQTSRAWVYIDYPRVENPETLTKEEYRNLKPYPVLWNAESVVNWGTSLNDDGTQGLKRVIIRNFVENFDENEFHPSYVDTVWVHEIIDGYYQIRKFEKKFEEAQVLVVNGRLQQKYVSGAQGAATTSANNTVTSNQSSYELVDTITNLMANGERLTFIPAWPLNGSIEPVEPMLTPLINKEVALYNKVSRRNHLLYGASTYTPVVSSDMTDDDFEEIVKAGLGSWIKIRQGDTVDVLKTPTDALVDMDRAIDNCVEEMAKLGVRMLAPEDNAQSGVALDIRNAAQTAQLGTLNTKISKQLSAIIAFMINWRFDLDLKASDVEFELSADFNPAPLGADWLRLCTEWYQNKLIPRSVWLQILKQNDMISPDYDDEHGREEILTDETVAPPSAAPDFLSKIRNMADSMKGAPTGDQSGSQSD